MEETQTEYISRIVAYFMLAVLVVSFFVFVLPHMDKLDDHGCNEICQEKAFKTARIKAGLEND